MSNAISIVISSIHMEQEVNAVESVLGMRGFTKAGPPRTRVELDLYGENNVVMELVTIMQRRGVISLSEEALESVKELLIVHDTIDRLRSKEAP